jgi:regulator of sirC expression with transglutaminase-like and TPR domain
MNDFSLAVTAAFVTAALELPLARQYPTTPPTGTLVRMAVAGGLTFVSILVAQRLSKKEKQQ